MKANSLILISLAVIASVNACVDAHSTAGNGGDCFCNAGYYGTSTDFDASGACQQCPNGTTSVPATTVGTLVTSCFCNDINAILKSDQIYCQCKANYYGTPNQIAGGASGCTACPAGTFSVAGATAITFCNICSDVNAFFNSYNPPFCQCKANYYGTPNLIAGGASGCTACPAGTFSVAGSTSIIFCNICSDVNAYLNSYNPPFCQCKANFYGTPNTSGGGCIECPAGTVSAAGSTTVTSCRGCADINASLNSSTPPVCQCKANFYGTPTTSSGGCITCPTGTISAAGSTTIYSCTCTDTNASLNSAIPPVCQCNPNFYGIPTSSGASGCTICPLGQTAPVGSVTNICKSAITSSTLILPIASLLFSLVLLI